MQQELREGEMEDQGDYFPLGKWQAENAAAERPCHSTVGDTDNVCAQAAGEEQNQEQIQVVDFLRFCFRC